MPKYNQISDSYPTKIKTSFPLGAPVSFTNKPISYFSIQASGNETIIKDHILGKWIETHKNKHNWYELLITDSQAEYSGGEFKPNDKRLYGFNLINSCLLFGCIPYSINGYANLVSDLNPGLFKVSFLFPFCCSEGYYIIYYMDEHMIIVCSIPQGVKRPLEEAKISPKITQILQKGPKSSRKSLEFIKDKFKELNFDDIVSSPRSEN